MPTSKSRTYSTLDELAHNAPKEYLLECHRDDLVEAILILRIKNNEPRKLIVPPRTSSQAKDQPPGSSVSTRPPSESQQGELARATRALDVANKDVRKLQLELDKFKVRAKEAEEKANFLVSIEQELREERAKVVEAEKKERTTLKELAAATRTEGNLYDDNHFRGEVENLRYSIDKSWVRNQSWRIIGVETASPNLAPYRFLEDICHDYHDYLYNQTALCTLVQAFIWDVLGRDVFGQNIWAQSGKELPAPDGQRGTRNPLSAWQAHISKFSSEELEIMYLTQLHQENWSIILRSLRFTTTGEWLMHA